MLAIMETIRSNRAFWRALHGLTNNVCLAAICALLVNDHFLRIRFPSWMTGKFGDFAWLVFAPFLCAAAFSWLIRGRRQECVVGIGSFGFIGLWFALAKTVPLINGWTIDALAWMLGYRGALRIDPTDLLTLPGLWIGWRVWQNSGHRPELLKSRAWLFVGLGTMATVATSSPAPQHRGIGRICRDGSNLFALEYPFDSMRGYVSHDDGLTWTSAASIGSDVLAGCGISRKRNSDGTENLQISKSPYQTDGILIDGDNQYRIANADTRTVVIPDPREFDNTPANSEQPATIQRSTDAGRTWQTELDPADIEDQTRAALHAADGHEFDPGPRDALIGPKGTVVLAMGTEGILVRTENGIWRWAEAGVYRHRTFGSTARLKLIFFEYPPYFYPGSLIPALIFTALAMLTIGNINPPELWKRALALTGWVLFLLWWLPIPFFSFIAALAISVLFPGLAVLAFIAARRVYRLDPKALRSLLTLSALAGGLFFFPLVLWAFDTVPSYVVAHFYGLGLGASAVIAGRLSIRRRYPQIFNLPLGPKASPPKLEM